MTNEELLQAISSVIQTQFQAMRTEFRAELQGVKEELRTEFHSEIQQLRKEMRLMEADLNGQIQHLSGQIQTLSGQTERLSKQIQQINITLENNITPRLQNIEDCYISTYDRYSKRTDQIDCMQADIDTLKPIVQEHSATLQRLA